MAIFTARIFYDASIHFSLGYRKENCITATYTALEHNTRYCTLQAEIHMGFLPCARHYIQGQHNYCETREEHFVCFACCARSEV